VTTLFVLKVWDSIPSVAKMFHVTPETHRASA
jgi:hypothetical protein